MSTVADYIGRQVDILAFKITSATQPAVQELAVAGGGGEVIAGPHKLAQRWAIEFLTDTGSIPAEPLRGTSFMPALRTGNIRTTVDAQQQFFFAADEARVNLIAEEDDTTPDDESYGDIELLSIAVDAGKLSLSVRVISVAGDSRDILLPLTTTLG